MLGTISSLCALEAYNRLGNYLTKLSSGEKYKLMGHKVNSVIMILLISKSLCIKWQ